MIGGVTRCRAPSLTRRYLGQERKAKERWGGVTEMFGILRLTALCLLLATVFLLGGPGDARASYICTRSAILIDAADGQVLYEQDADTLIPPASVTKILTLYLAFDAIKQGQIHPWDLVRISQRAANTGGSRMGLRAGTEVPVEELIKGIGVVSGNDAAVAMAEHLSGSVEDFVEKMNIKAKQLGMVNSEFKTPNGLPAQGQVTTARDLAKLSSSYIQHYPEALHIHSMTSYTYCKATHHNANRLLGVCPGVDGIKTGFVCAAGFNLAATAKRGDVRLIAVVMGARAPWVRTVETEKLLEAGFQKMAADSGDSPSVEQILAKRESSGRGKAARLASAPHAAAGDGSAAHLRHSKTAKGSGKVQGSSKTHNKSSATQIHVEKKATGAEDSGPALKQPNSGTSGGKQKLLFVKQTMPLKKAGPAEKPEATERDTVKKKSSPGKEASAVKNGGSLKKQKEAEKPTSVQVFSKSSNGSKQKPVPEPTKKTDKKS